MAKGRNKGYWGVFSGPKAFVAVILLAVIIPVVGRVLGAVFAQANRQITLLSATVSAVENSGGPVLKESGIKAKTGRPGPYTATDNLVDDPEQSGQWQTVRMRVTAYCPCPKCCGKYSDGITACGHKIRSGDAFVAADKKYSFGTEMIIPGYNNEEPVKVLDRGGAIRGNRLDIFFHSHEEALKWGVRYLDVKVRQK